MTRSRLKYYYFIGGLVASGVGLAIVSVPSYKDIAMMQIYEKKYDVAFERYKSYYDNGDRSIDVMIPLAELYEKHAQIDQAIGIMEEFMEKYPDLLQGWEVLGQYYLDAGRQYDYAHALEEVYRLDPSEEVLRRQFTFFDFFQDKQESKEALEKLSAHHIPTEDEVVQLSGIYLSENESQKAKDVIRHHAQTHSKQSFDASFLQYMAQLFNGEEEKKVVVEVLESQMEVLQEEGSFLAKVNLLSQLNRKEQALNYVLDWGDKKGFSKRLTLETLSLYGDTNRKKEAFIFVRGLYERGRLDDSFLRDAVDLAFQAKDTDFVRAVLVEKFEKIDGETLLKVLLISAKQNHREIISDLNYLKKRSQRSFLASFDTGIATVNGEGVEAVEDLSDQQKAVIAVLDDEKTDLMIASINDWDQVFPWLIDDIIDKGIEHNQIDLLWSLTARYKGDPFFVRPRIALAVATGKRDEVFSGLEKLTSYDPFLWQALGSIAKKYEQFSLMEEIAQFARERALDSYGEEEYFRSLVWNGKRDKAQVVLSQFVVNGTYLPLSYLEDLSQFASLEESREELEDHIDHYVALELSMSEREELGHILVKVGEIGRAKAIFQELSEGMPFESDNPQMVVWLMGKELSEDDFEWVVARLEGESSKSRLIGFQLLYETNYKEAVLDLIEVDDLEHLQTVDFLADLLSEQNKKDQLRLLIISQVEKESDPKRLLMWGKRSYANGMTPLTFEIFERVLNDPSHPIEVHRELGIVYAEQGYYENARIQLCIYLEKQANDALAIRNLADIAYYNKEWIRAHNLYLRSLLLLDAKPEKELYEELVEANLCYKLHLPKRACETYFDLMKRYPDDLSVRIECVLFLIEMDRLSSAYRLWCESQNRIEGKDADQKIAFELTYLRYLMHAGKRELAKQLICDLLNRYPTSPAVIVAAADWNNGLGLWKRGVCFYRKAQEIEPCNYNYANAIEQIYFENQSHLNYTFEYKMTKVTRLEHLHHFSGIYQLCPNGYLYGEWLLDRYSADTVLLSDGTVRRHLKGAESRGFAGFGYDFCNGVNFQSQIAWNETFVGAVVSATKNDIRGRWHGHAEINTPTWNFFESVVQQGTWDQIRLARTHLLAPHLEGYFAVAYRRYHLKGFKEAATSRAFQSSLSCLFPPRCRLLCILGEDSFLSANYLLDAEYPITVRKHVGLQPNRFAPVNLVGRETHTGTIQLGRQANAMLRWEGFVGVTADRVAKKGGLTYGAQIHGGRKGSAQIRCEYSHYVSTDGTDSDVDQLIFNFDYPF